MTRSILTLTLCTAAMAIGITTAAQDAAQAPEEDEIIVTGTVQTDPAMSAFRAGDYATAEIEFDRNAMCALRVTRNFRAGIESAFDSTIQANVGTDANVAASPTGGQGGVSGQAVGATAGVAPSYNVNTRNLAREKSDQRRTCQDRGFQIYMRGMSELKLGKVAEAKKSLSQAVILKRSLYDAHFRLALMAYQDGQTKDAIKHAKAVKAIEKKCRRCDDSAVAEMKGQLAYLDSLLGETL